MTSISSTPLIGVTTHAGHWCPPWWAIAFAIRRAGGKAVRISPRHPVDLAQLDGVVMSGGTDICPQLYGEEPDPTYAYDKSRDALESDVIDYVMQQQLPLLAICRCCQLLNVKLGGALFTDITRQRKLTSNRSLIHPGKFLFVRPDSLLHRITEHERLRINSLHHQAIREVAPGFLISGTDADGFTQAIESPAHPHLLGVQWHPEYLPYMINQAKLFKWLVKQADARQG
ncbi:type 1 glutamine amidotransferase [Lacimicrobium sp. SS2-24]|uniref:gamma-glutamyl-gamma-aminobutyrate hydrolase family protein n=1 Tax=Lacimicrobium sp. SS2-24 TaxID=2005569 RepID=UPI001AF00FB4|nr:type 1 glutamine amidotransferase [Lacimicrobium sp. SS2-24]